MQLQKILADMTGQEAADLIYSNDGKLLAQLNVNYASRTRGAVNIDAVAKTISTSDIGYVTNEYVYQRVSIGTTNWQYPETANDGIYFIVFDTSDKLLHVIHYTVVVANPAINYMIVGLFMMQPNGTIQGISFPSEIKVNGKYIYTSNEDLTDIYSRLSSIESVLYQRPAEQSDISDLFTAKNTYRLNGGTLTVTTPTPVVRWDGFLLNTVKMECTPLASPRVPWFIIGYENANSFCAIGGREFPGQIVNVNLADQTYTVVKSTAITPKEGKLTIAWDGDNFTDTREDGTVMLSYSQSDLLSLGAKVQNKAIGVTFFNVNGVSLNNSTVCNAVRIIAEGGGDVKIKSPLTGKIISIMGDSISTYSGYIPSGNATYYPNNDVQSVGATWWMKLINETGAILGINNSWSGSRISNGRGTASMFNAPTRYENLGKPDIILVFGGTNDMGQGNPNTDLGEYNLITDGTRDLSVFKQAYQNLVEKLQATYPAARIVLLAPTQRNAPIFENLAGGWGQLDLKTVIGEISVMYGTDFIDLTKCGINHYNFSQFLNDGLHPTTAGMDKIYSYVRACLEAIFIQ